MTDINLSKKVVVSNMCLFCKIVKKEESAYIVYEDEYTVAFLDKFPLAPGHTLVVTKEHFDDFLNTKKEYLEKLAFSSNIVSRAVKESVKSSGIRLLTNVGKSAGQVIFHVHIHIIPTWDGSYPEEFSYFEPRKEQRKEYYEFLQRVISQNVKNILSL